MSFLKASLLTIVCFALLGAVPSISAATPPACTEYCYDPIPGGKPSPPATDPSQPDQVPDGSDGDGSDAGGTVAGPGSGDGSGGAGPAGERQPKSDRELALKLGVDQSRMGSGAPFGTGGPNQLDEAAAVSTSSIGMLLILALLMAGALILAWRKGEGLSGVLRVGALGVVLVVLTVVGTGNALAAKRAAVPNGFFGAVTQSELTQSDADRLARGGNEMMRLPVQWHVVQPSPNAFDWSTTDAFIGTAAKAGMKVLPFLYDSPGWLTGRVTALPVQNSRQKQAWKRFVAAAVDRYGPKGSYWAEHGPGSDEPVPRKPIRVWQIWNEANFHYFAEPVSPSRYAKLLSFSSQSIKKRDPRAKIMLAGLFGSPKNIPGRAMKSWTFLKQLYRLKAKRNFDIVAVHPYTPSTSQLKLLMDRVRNVMVRSGDRSARLAITEIGWGSDRRTVFGMGSRAAQAAQLRSAYRTMIKRRRALNLTSIYWFAVQDLPATTTSCNFCYSTGLFRAKKAGTGPDASLVAKPVWKQYVKLAGGLR